MKKPHSKKIYSSHFFHQSEQTHPLAISLKLLTNPFQLITNSSQKCSTYLGGINYKIISILEKNPRQQLHKLLVPTMQSHLLVAPIRKATPSWLGTPFHFQGVDQGYISGARRRSNFLGEGRHVARAWRDRVFRTKRAARISFCLSIIL